MSIIKDLSLADWGRKEILLAELEMPGLMSYRLEHSISKPLTGARISGALHMTIQTAVLIETLKHCGADKIRWCSCNVLSTQDHAAAAIVKAETATVFAWKGETLREFWESMVHAVTFEDEEGPSLIVDDGCDMTIFLLEGYNCERTFEKTGELPNWETYEIDSEREMMKMIRELLEKDKKIFTKLTKNLKGVSEETTSGATRLYQLQEKGMLKFPAINVNNSVTKTKFDNIYGCRQSVADGLMRATDIMIAGKKVLICGYGDVGKGCAASMKGCGAIVYITEIDPICALQACMEGYEVVTLERVVKNMDIFITTTGNKNIILASHMSQMKNNAILGNMGNFDNEIDIPGLKKISGISKIKIKDQVDKWIFEDGHGIIVLAEGRLLNLACATGHPSFVMSNSFTNQAMAINELWTHRNSGQYKNFVYKLSKQLDEKVAKLHLKALGAELTILTTEQAEYINVKPDGPFKNDKYRY